MRTICPLVFLYFSPDEFARLKTSLKSTARLASLRECTWEQRYFELNATFSILTSYVKKNTVELSAMEYLSVISVAAVM